MTDHVSLDVSGLRYEYRGRGSTHVAIDGVDFTVRDGELVSVVGPSGCGKTTLLRCIAGLLDPTEGSIALLGEPVHGVPDGLAVVFQEYTRSLFAWMRVAANVEFPLKRLPLSAEERRRRVGESLRAVGLDEVGDRYPWQLSGGMQQRVAIARALAYRPRILLMDEPFASVDAQTRADLEDLLLDVKARYEMTIVVVTHDIDESIYLADRLVVLSRSPTHVVSCLDIPLPYPRDQIRTKELDAFVELRAEVARTIRHEAAPVAAPQLVECEQA
jgi:NitT/TauT family transport system ATP-binding protein